MLIILRLFQRAQSISKILHCNVFTFFLPLPLPFLPFLLRIATLLAGHAPVSCLLLFTNRPPRRMQLLSRNRIMETSQSRLVASRDGASPALVLPPKLQNDGPDCVALLHQVNLDVVLAILLDTQLELTIVSASHSSRQGRCCRSGSCPARVLLQRASSVFSAHHPDFSTSTSSPCLKHELRSWEKMCQELRVDQSS